jgi:S-adenosylmethionine decarboxylase
MTGVVQTSRPTAAPRAPDGEQPVGDEPTGGEVFEFFGRHLMASYVGCDAAALSDRAGLMAAMRAAVKASGATLLNSIEHSFSPAGMTAVMLLSESHASIHTYPEHGACFVDLFTCGRLCSAERFDTVLRAYLRPQSVDCKIAVRHGGGRASGAAVPGWPVECAA